MPACLPAINAAFFFDWKPPPTFLLLCLHQAAEPPFLPWSIDPSFPSPLASSLHHREAPCTARLPLSGLLMIATSNHHCYLPSSLFATPCRSASVASPLAASSPRMPPCYRQDLSPCYHSLRTPPSFAPGHAQICHLFHASCSSLLSAHGFLSMSPCHLTHAAIAIAPPLLFAAARLNPSTALSIMAATATIFFIHYRAFIHPLFFPPSAHHA